MTTLIIPRHHHISNLIYLILSQITLIQWFWCFLSRNKKTEFPLHTVAWVVSHHWKFTNTQVRFSRLRFTCQIHLTKKFIMEKNLFLRLQEPAIRIHGEQHCWFIKKYQSNPEYLAFHCELTNFQEIPIYYSIQTAAYAYLLLGCKIYRKKNFAFLVLSFHENEI